MATAHARMAALAFKVYEQRDQGSRVDLHQLVSGRSWVLVGRQGRRMWLKFLEHRDTASIRAIDTNNSVIVLQRLHVLSVWTMAENAVQLRMISLRSEPDCKGRCAVRLIGRKKRAVQQGVRHGPP